MRNLKSLVGAAAIVVALCAGANAQAKARAKSAAAQNTTVEYQSASNPSARTLSDFVRVGNILYLSGKLGTDTTGNLVPGGIGPETKQTMENIKAVLDKNGSSMDHVIKCTVMLADIKEWADMNTVYTTFFKKERLPARSALGVSGLVRNARVEIECMATLK
ncbi:MAG TPA: RidA family protein [Blastocatellia bacterium]|nr:RidA family protein [Blastocatellia bacterium]